VNLLAFEYLLHSNFSGDCEAVFGWSLFGFALLLNHPLLPTISNYSA
jgi:hypothetical protein